MDTGFSIGKIFGIKIKIDWSWLFIFLLITWNLAVMFGQTHSDWGLSLRWGLALVASLLFFASVLAHELGHSLTAQAQGVSVRSITLFLFGGVSNIQRQPPSPRAEFLITIVGPITSIVLGLGFILLGALTSTVQLAADVSDPTRIMSQFSPTTTLLLWLGWINVLLGVFNMIPGFPLDGGRILRSILWAITDNLRRATRWASYVGQFVAWGFIFIGISMIFGVQVPFFGTGLIGGLWLVFIGWFLNSASVQSYQQVVIQDILEDVPVEEVMRTNPPVVQPDSSVSQLVHDHIMGTDDHAFPVLDNEQFIGLVTLEDVRSISRDEWQTTQVREIMTPLEALITAQISEDAAESLQKLMQKDVRQLPIIEDNHLAGLLRRRDVMKWLKLQSEAV